MDFFKHPLAACLLLVLVPAHSQVASAAADLACEDPGASMLWRVEASTEGAAERAPSAGETPPGQDREVYLFGSIHLGKADFYPLHERIEQAFRTADYLVFEVDPAAAADPAVLTEMQFRALLPPGQTLSDVVSPEVVEKLREVMSGMGLSADPFMGMQPWFITLMLTGLQMNEYGYLPLYGVESYLTGNKSAEAEVLELESIRQQMEFLQGLNAETYLAYALEGFDEGREALEGLIRAWRCADKEELADYLFEEFGKDAAATANMADLREKLFYGRNEQMTRRITDFIDNGTGDYFIVIGAGHLLGERSVVDLLRRGGYAVTPVTLP